LISLQRVSRFKDSSCGSLASVTIPDSVTSIGEAEFYDCHSLTNITIPDSVTSIGDSAFMYCYNVASVTIPDGVTNIGGSAFWDCNSLTNITIPEGVTSIGDSAFFYCKSLANVTIPDGLTTIATNTFAYCFSLTHVRIPNSVTNIGSYAFGGCTGLTGVYFQGNSPTPSDDLTLFNGIKTGTVYYLPDTSGWGTLFDGWPTELWRPQVQTGGAGFGVGPNGFGFSIAWASGASIVVEAAPDPANPVWIPVWSNIVSGGIAYFSDPQWRNFPARLYRVR
jgi:hypothetical protein